jgi:hypothetical protein
MDAAVREADRMADRHPSLTICPSAAEYHVCDYELGLLLLSEFAVCNLCFTRVPHV